MLENEARYVQREYKDGKRVQKRAKEAYFNLSNQLRTDTPVKIQISEVEMDDFPWGVEIELDEDVVFSPIK